MSIDTEICLLLSFCGVSIIILYYYFRYRLRLIREFYTNGVTIESYALGYPLLNLVSFALLYIIYSLYRKQTKFSKEFFMLGITMDMYSIRIPLESRAHQQEDVFNISSRVQGQEHQWPTQDAHLSIDHIRIMNEMNKPPSYNDDPPSYEEAMRIAAALSQQGESSTPPVIVVAPKPTSTN